MSMEMGLKRTLQNSSSLTTFGHRGIKTFRNSIKHMKNQVKIPLEKVRTGPC